MADTVIDSRAGPAPPSVQAASMRLTHHSFPHRSLGFTSYCSSWRPKLRARVQKFQFVENHVMDMVMTAVLIISTAICTSGFDEAESSQASAQLI